jgi:methionine salvage enolase-phosphatase E1
MVKKITAIVSLSLILMVIAATIVLINIHVNHNIQYNNPKEIWVTFDGGPQIQVTEQEDVDKILKIMKKETSENMLSAIFNKSVNEKPELVNYKDSSVSIPETNGFYVIFNYENPQLLEGDVYYTNLIFTVEQKSGEKEVKVYISEDGSMNYRKYYQLTVDYSDIYNLLEDKGFNS